MLAELEWRCVLSPLPWCVRRAAVVAAAVAAAPQAAASAATGLPGNRTQAARVCASSSLSAVAPSSAASSAAAAAAAWCVLRACVCERERALAVSAHMRASAQRARPHSLNWSRARHSARRSHARASGSVQVQVRSFFACPCDRAGAFSGCPQREHPLKSFYRAVSRATRTHGPPAAATGHNHWCRGSLSDVGPMWGR